MSAQKRFRVGARHERDRLILELHGELDMASAHLARRGPSGCEPWTTSCAAVVLDLHGVQFTDSTGLKAIFRVRKAVRDGGRSSRSPKVRPRCNAC